MREQFVVTRSRHRRGRLDRNKEVDAPSRDPVPRDPQPMTKQTNPLPKGSRRLVQAYDRRVLHRPARARCVHGYALVPGASAASRAVPAFMRPGIEEPRATAQRPTDDGQPDHRDCEQPNDHDREAAQRPLRPRLRPDDDDDGSHDDDRRHDDDGSHVDGPRARPHRVRHPSTGARTWTAAMPTRTSTAAPGVMPLGRNTFAKFESMRARARRSCTGASVPRGRTISPTEGHVRSRAEQGTSHSLI